MDADCAAGTGNGLNLNLDLALVDLDREMLRPLQHSCANLSHRLWTAVLSTYLCRLYDVRLCPAQSAKENVELVDYKSVDMPLRRHCY